MTTVTGKQPPASSLSNPVTQIIGSSIVTQFPFPSYLYPAWHDGFGTGTEAMQFPFPSLWYPKAQVRGGIDGSTEVDLSSSGRQLPCPSAKNPDGHVSLIVVGTSTVSSTHYPSA